MAAASAFPSLLLLAVAVGVALAAVARGDIESDRKECGDSLMGLATCLKYVVGESRAPTPDCCSGLRQTLLASPKCLCILIKDHENPAVDLKLDPVRVMSLPSECGATANISSCPRLLNIPPNSTEARIFEDFKNRSHENGTANSTSMEAALRSSSNHAGRSRLHGVGEDQWWRWMSVEILACFVASLLVLVPSS